MVKTLAASKLVRSHKQNRSYANVLRKQFLGLHLKAQELERSILLLEMDLPERANLDYDTRAAVILASIKETIPAFIDVDLTDSISTDGTPSTVMDRGDSVEYLGTGTPFYRAPSYGLTSISPITPCEMASLADAGYSVLSDVQVNRRLFPDESDEPLDTISACEHAQNDYVYTQMMDEFCL